MQSHAQIWSIEREQKELSMGEPKVSSFVSILICTGS